VRFATASPTRLATLALPADIVPAPVVRHAPPALPLPPVVPPAVESDCAMSTSELPTLHSEPSSELGPSPSASNPNNKWNRRSWFFGLFRIIIILCLLYLVVPNLMAAVKIQLISHGAALGPEEECKIYSWLCPGWSRPDAEAICVQENPPDPSVCLWLDDSRRASAVSVEWHCRNGTACGKLRRNVTSDRWADKADTSGASLSNPSEHCEMVIVGIGTNSSHRDPPSLKRREVCTAGAGVDFTFASIRFNIACLLLSLWLTFVIDSGEQVDVVPFAGFSLLLAVYPAHLSQRLAQYVKLPLSGSDPTVWLGIEWFVTPLVELCQVYLIMCVGAFFCFRVLREVSKWKTRRSKSTPEKYTRAMKIAKWCFYLLLLFFCICAMFSSFLCQP
jgi:hypothetical protein